MKVLVLFVFLLLVNIVNSQEPGLVVSESGLRLPQMTTNERNTISSPSLGLTIYNIDLNCMEIYRSRGWYCLDSLGYYSKVNNNFLLGGNNNEEAIDIKPINGGMILAGSSRSSQNGDVTGSNYGQNDYWIARLDTNGLIVWNRLLGGVDYEFTRGIVCTPDAKSTIFGYTRSSESGDISGLRKGTHDSWIVHLDQSGRIEWEILIGEHGFNEAYDVVSTDDGGYLVGGRSNSPSIGGEFSKGGYDYWLIKINDSGTIEWQKLIGGNDQDFFQSISRTSDGFLLAGFSSSSESGDVTGVSNGGSDYWIVKIDDEGNIQWDRLLGGVDSDFPGAIETTSDGGSIVVGGSFSSSSGDISGESNGVIDAWIV